MSEIQSKLLECIGNTGILSGAVVGATLKCGWLLVPNKYCLWMARRLGQYNCCKGKSKHPGMVQTNRNSVHKAVSCFIIKCKVMGSRGSRRSYFKTASRQ